MNCPRCGGALTRYRLDERETVGCESCEYIGVSVDHTVEGSRPESWDDAIDRFQNQGESVTTVTLAELPDVPDADPAADGTLPARLNDDDERVLPIFVDDE